MKTFSRITLTALCITLLLAVLTLIPDPKICDHSAGDTTVKAVCEAPQPEGVKVTP
jgi:hypothetical protein